MAWTSARTWVAGEVVTATIMNSAVRDNLRYLHGDDGTITLGDGLNLGANELTINNLETVGVDGIVNKEQVEDHTHADAANCGTVDHGVLTGLADDDHTQYTKHALATAADDFLVASGAGVFIKKTKAETRSILSLNSKIITSTRALAAATGDVAYTGVGFTPTIIIAYLYDSAAGADWASVGFSDEALAEVCLYWHDTGVSNGGSFLCYIKMAAGYQTAVVKTYDADGFTLTWTKTDLPTGTAGLLFLCLA